MLRYSGSLPRAVFGLLLLVALQAPASWADSVEGLSAAQVAALEKRVEQRWQALVARDYPLLLAGTTLSALTVLAGSFLAGRLADDMHAFIAPMLLGPRGRPGAVDWAGPDTPAQAPRIAKPSWELCGTDAYVHDRLTYPD